MNCASCGTATTTRFCPNCGADVWNSAGTPPGRPVTTAPASDVRNWVTACHLSALAGLVVPFGNIIGPLVVWLLKRDESPLIDREGKEALNFQISMTIYLMISGLLVFALIGIPLVFLVAVLDLIFTIVGAVQSGKDAGYRYPLTIRFLK